MKLAFPKVRRPRIRPAVVTSGRSASRASPVLSPCASTIAVTDAVRSNRCGYGAAPERTISSRFAFRWAACSASLDIGGDDCTGLGLRHQAGRRGGLKAWRREGLKAGRLEGTT